MHHLEQYKVFFYYSKQAGLQVFLISFILGILLLSFTAVLKHPLILEVT